MHYGNDARFPCRLVAGLLLYGFPNRRREDRSQFPSKNHILTRFLLWGEAMQPNAVIDVLLIETLLKNSGPKNRPWNGTKQSRRRKYLEHKNTFLELKSCSLWWRVMTVAVAVIDQQAPPPESLTDILPCPTIQCVKMSVWLSRHSFMLSSYPLESFTAWTIPTDSILCRAESKRRTSDSPPDRLRTIWGCYCGMTSDFKIYLSQNSVLPMPLSLLTCFPSLKRNNCMASLVRPRSFCVGYFLQHTYIVIFVHHLLRAVAAI